MTPTEDDPNEKTGSEPSPALDKIPFWNEKRVESVIGRLLQLGVISAALVVMIGGALYLVRGGEPSSHYHLFTGEREDLRTVSGVLDNLRAPTPRVIIQLGLLLLILTPISRVAFSVCAFALEKDYLYVVVTLVVLAILMYSLMGHYA